MLTALAVTLAGCDSAVITGTGAPEFGAAMAPALIADGTFELGAASWQSCSDNGSSETDNDASEGNLALQVSNGACRYQNADAVTSQSYQLSCDAKRSADGWSSVTMAFLDQNLEPLDSQEIAVTSNTYAPVQITMTAPEFTTKTEVLFYSDGVMSVDNCTLTEITIPAPSIALQNGSFDEGLNGWNQCSQVTATADSGNVTVASGACINQRLDVSAAVSASAANDPVTVNYQCDQISKADDNYAAAIVAFLDERNNPLATSEQPIYSATTSTAVRLSAPAGTRTLEVMIYSDGATSVGQCALTAL